MTTDNLIIVFFFNVKDDDNFLFAICFLKRGRKGMELGK